MARFARQSSGLVRELSVLDVFNINFSFMGPAAGILYPLAIAFTLNGSNWVLASILGALMTLPISIMYYYLSKEIPLTGGDYVYISRFLGPRWGFIEAIGNLSFFLFGIPILAMFEVTLVIVPILQIIGYTYSIPSLLSFTDSLLSPTNLFAISSILIVFATVVNLMKIKNIARVINILTLLQIIGTIAILISLLSISHQKYVSTLLSLKALAVNPSSSITVSNPLTTLVLASLIVTSVYLYSSASVWVNGEVKRGENVFLVGILGSFLVAIAFTVLLVYSIVRTIGEGLFTYVEVNGWNLPFSPSSIISFIAIPGLVNPFLLYVILLGALTWDILYLIMNVTIPSRVLFAMSFDRAFPEKFSSVKNSIPYVAVITIGVLALFFNYIEVFLGFGVSEIVDLIIYVVYQYMLTSISAIKIGLKYKYPSLLVTASASLMSLILTVGSMFYYSAVSQEFLSQIYYGSTLVNVGVLVGISVLGLLLFEGIRRYRLSREKIDIIYNYKELPPE